MIKITEEERKEQHELLKRFLPNACFVRLRPPNPSQNQNDEKKLDEKKPIELSWQTKTTHTFKTFILTKYPTYGVLCGYQNLFVIDFDNQQTQDKILTENPLLFDTLRVKTALKGLLHCYFYSDQPPDGMVVKDEVDTTLLDLKGIGGQVLGPGSIIKGKMYAIENKKPVKKVNYTKICEILQAVGSQQKPKTPITETKMVYDEEDRKVHEELNRQLTVPDVLNEFGVIGTSNPGQCPFGHHSERNACFSYNNEQWYCFNCQRKGNALSLYAQLKNITNKEAYVIMKKRFGLKDGYDLKQEERRKKQEEQYNTEKKKVTVYRLLPITRFLIYTNKEDSSYELRFGVENKEEIVIRLNPSSILLVNEFRVRYFNETGTLLPKITTASWEQILLEWGDFKEIVRSVSGTDESTVACETIINELSGYCMVSDVRHANANGRALCIPTDPEVVYISSANINNIIKKNRLRQTMGEIRTLLDKYMVGTSKVIRISTNRVARFWAFKKELLPLEEWGREEDDEDN